MIYLLMLPVNSTVITVGLHNSLSAQLCRGSTGLNITTIAVLEAKPRAITLRRLNQGSFVLVYFVSYSVAFLMV